MRQVFLKKSSILVKEVCQPLMDDTTVLVAVHYSCITAGTEVATIAAAQHATVLSNLPEKMKKVLMSVADHGIGGTAALIKSKVQGELQTVGYASSGQVIAVGKKVTQLRVGDFVACAGAGFAHHADIVVVPEYLTAKVSKQDFLKSASLTTLGALALQGIRRANVQLGEYVCIFGLGLVGQISVQLARRAGCKVIAIDVVPERLELAKKMGADFVYHAQEDNIRLALDFLTHHHGVDVALVTAATAGNEWMQQALQVVRKKGKVVVVGDAGSTLGFTAPTNKELDISMAYSYSPERHEHESEHARSNYPYVRWNEQRNMQTFLDFVEQGQVDVAPLISHQYPLEQAAQAYEVAATKQGLGVVLSYEQEKNTIPADTHSHATAQEHSAPPAALFKAARKDQVRLGVIGASGFAKIKLIPLVAALKHVQINAVADADIANSMNVSKLYGAAKACVADKELLESGLVDAVIIASPYTSHCDQTIAALSRGKAVLVEKPMVTDFEQLDRMRTFLHANPDVPLCVDYNRSFSPFMQKIKATIKDRTSPLIAHYRMNVGFVPKNHWAQTETSSGRIIGDACHIFDLFCFLTDARPIAVSVESLHAHRDDLFPTDNFSAQISFDDGSVCSLLYTALGHDGLGTERMELFFDSKAIVMDDYARLTGYGLPQSFNETMHVSDKGQSALLDAFFTTLMQPNAQPPIDRLRLDRVAEITLVVDKLACQGGGSQELGT